MISIIGFNKKYAKQFFLLNKSWIEESWHLEDSDKKDLLNPDKIVHNGGQVFFALENQKAIGTVAMIKSSDDRFELAKMTVQDDFRGKGIANMLMDECLKSKIQKFYYASSSSVYGNQIKVPYSENDQVTKPESFYAATKTLLIFLCRF